MHITFKRDEIIRAVVGNESACVHALVWATVLVHAGILACVGLHRKCAVSYVCRTACKCTDSFVCGTTWKVVQFIIQG